jgi:hypothetical protein
MQCPEKGNPREFLEGLRVMKEELAQAVSNQLAAAQFLSSRSITPDDLLSMLVEESDRQRAQWQH